MGLIKTAMMTGGGIYAVKQLAKTQERRHDAQQNNNYQGQGYPRGDGNPNQGYWGPPGPPGPPPRAYGDYQQDPREWSSNNQYENGRYPPHTRGNYAPGDYSEEKRVYAEDDFQYQQRIAGNPPSYYPQQPQQNSYYPQQPQQGYTNAPQYQDGDRGGQSALGGLAGMAMEYAGNASGGGKDGKKLGKGKDMVSEFFGK